jgi:hypothetical protein
MFGGSRLLQHPQLGGCFPQLLLGPRQLLVHGCQLLRQRCFPGGQDGDVFGAYAGALAHGAQPQLLQGALLPPADHLQLQALVLGLSLEQLTLQATQGLEGGAGKASAVLVGGGVHVLGSRA